MAGRFGAGGVLPGGARLTRSGGRREAHARTVLLSSNEAIRSPGLLWEAFTLPSGRPGWGSDRQRARGRPTSSMPQRRRLWDRAPAPAPPPRWASLSAESIARPAAFESRWPAWATGRLASGAAPGCGGSGRVSRDRSVAGACALPAAAARGGRERVSALGFSVGGLNGAGRRRAAPRWRGTCGRWSSSGYHDLPEYLVSVPYGRGGGGPLEKPGAPHEETVRRVREVPAAKLGLGACPGGGAPGGGPGPAAGDSRRRAGGSIDLNPAAPPGDLSGRGSSSSTTARRPSSPTPNPCACPGPRPRAGGAFLLTDLFQHVQPRAGFSWGIVQDVVALATTASPRGRPESYEVQVRGERNAGATWPCG